jgi:hypothetical protein
MFNIDLTPLTNEFKQLNTKIATFNNSQLITNQLLTEIKLTNQLIKQILENQN